MTTCSIGGPDIYQRIIAKVVNVLDECFDAFTNFPFPHLLALFLSPRDFITRQRFAKHSDERSVARKKDSVRRLIIFTSRG